MGRTLSNTMMNIGVQAAIDEALYQVCTFYEFVLKSQYFCNRDCDFYSDFMQARFLNHYVTMILFISWFHVSLSRFCLVLAWS